MLYWNPKRCYRLFTSEERAVIITEMAPLYLPKLLRFCNTILNILLPLYLYVQLQFSWLELAIAFIALDITLICFEQFVLITIPWTISKIPLRFIAKLNHNSLKRRLYRAKDKLDLYHKTRYINRSEPLSSSERCLETKQLKDYINTLEDLVEATGARVRAFDEKETPVFVKSTATHEETITTTQIDKNLPQHFKNVSERFGVLVNEHRFTFLLPLCKSCDSMAQILSANPAGERSVSGALCQKLDTIIKISELISLQSADERAKHIATVQRAARILNDELHRCVISASKASPELQPIEELLAQLSTEKEMSNV